jgi:hypothetical protein
MKRYDTLDTLSAVMSALRSMDALHNQTILPRLKKHEGTLDSTREDVEALYELVEMYFYVLTYALLHGVFDKSDDGSRDVEESFRSLNEIQETYLSVISVAIFLSGLGKPN